MLVYIIGNDIVILWARECPRSHLFYIPSRNLKAHKIYIFEHKAIGYPSHDLMQYVNIFFDSDLISSKPRSLTGTPAYSPNL
jgi:hypothetical protein